MRRLLVTIFLLWLFTRSYSQISPASFGEIPKADMTMKVYDQDTSASAVVLFDYGVAYISSVAKASHAIYAYGSNFLNKEFYFYFERHVRIKILKKEGLGQGNISIPLFKIGSLEENVTELKAATYNLDSDRIVVTKIGEENIYKESFNNYFDQVKFAMPKVKEGSVIEYSYRIKSDFLFNFPNWQFQRLIPTRLSEYWAMIPDFFRFEKYMQGYVPLTSYEVGDTHYYGEKATGYHFVSKNVPAFKPEPYMTSENDYISQVNFAFSHFYSFEILGSWDTLADRLRNSSDFGSAVSGYPFLKDFVEKTVKDINDPVSKIEAISNYIKKNFEWDEFKNFRTQSLKKVFEKKKGSSGDLNLLLGSMLNKAGFDVEMVLLSTRDHGFVRPSYPIERQFNYVIASVKVDNKTVLLDATEKYLPYDVLPARCLNGKGLRIGTKFYDWIEITPTAKQKTFVNANLVLSESGELKGRVDYTRDGYDAHEMRTEYFKKGEEKYKKDFLGGKHWEIEKTEFKNISDLTAATRVSYEVQIGEHATSIGDVIYLNPFVALRTEENPFKSKDREFPIDFGSRLEKTYNFRITVPDGYSVEELPKSSLFALPENSGRYMYNVVQTGNTVNVTSNFIINKSLFVQTEYANIREFYNRIVAKQAEQIVLKKKK